jgi:hypothetical protein
MRMSERGREMVAQDIANNGVTFIHESNLRSSINTWASIYLNNLPGSKYKTFINIGEGEASLGHPKNGDLIPNGFNPRLPPKNYPAHGLMFRFSENGSSILNVYDIAYLAEQYELPAAPIPTPAVGEGDLFYAMEYDETVTIAAVVIVFVLVITLIVLDARLFRMKDEGVDPDTLM